TATLMRRQMNGNADGRRWWHGAVIYQLYVRSWQDSNDDGYGDLRGIIERLDYLSWLGVDAVWLSPTMPSPDDDWGYDVSDYTGRPAWQWHDSGQYYLHNFLPGQPDLNWWEPAVHREFARILEFWFERGVAGFRIDVANGLYKDAELRDNPPLDSDDPLEGVRGLRF